MNHCLAALWVVAFAAAASAHAAPDPNGPAALTADELKSAYLDCDRRATAAFLDAADAATCSIVHEELKQRVFGGDFDRLLTWWRAQRPADEKGDRRTAQRER